LSHTPLIESFNKKVSHLSTGDIIQQYPFKRGFKPEPDRIRSVLGEQFPAVTEDGGKFVTSYGAFSRMSVWVENKNLCVDTESRSGISDEIILDTNRRFRKFLEAATGLSAKERVKRAKKEVEDAG